MPEEETYVHMGSINASAPKDIQPFGTKAQIKAFKARHQKVVKSIDFLTDVNLRFQRGLLAFSSEEYMLSTGHRVRVFNKKGNRIISSQAGVSNAKAAADADVFPVEAHITARAPSETA